MRLQVPYLVDVGPTVVSLTAGQDTRTTLAAIGARKNDFQYFTYALNYSTRLKYVIEDVQGTKKLADYAKLQEYSVLNINEPLKDGLLFDVLKRSSPFNSGRGVAAEYFRSFSRAKVHLRSSIAEVGVLYYRAKFGDKPSTAEYFSDILTQNRGGYTQETLLATQQYMEETGILEVDGYDPIDLYFWEIRNGSWLSNINAESDIAIDTHSLFNSRLILRLSLSQKAEDRLSMKHYHRLIQIAWPELYDVPVNGKMQSFPA
ncbi:hypothetical protein DDA93_13475 [Arthrobacter sp. Bz4]|nr:hypothetical protein DDA93_13475 [Arthrobacter sp. Bz4]